MFEKFDRALLKTTQGKRASPTCKCGGTQAWFRFDLAMCTSCGAHITRVFDRTGPPDGTRCRAQAGQAGRADPGGAASEGEDQHPHGPGEGAA